jgi:NADH-quinone oxidoreductase subunit C
MWAYEIPGCSGSASRLATEKIVVYNFHTFASQARVHVFSVQVSNYRSLAELFPAANWLERELRELHGTEFSHKKDVRNLMLQYGDTSAPFRKSFPTVGLRELYYDPIQDGVAQQNLTLQL